MSAYIFVFIGVVAAYLLGWMTAHPLGQQKGYHDGYLDASRDQHSRMERRERIGL